MRFACLAAGLAAFVALGPGEAGARGYHDGGYRGGYGYHGGHGYRGGFGFRPGPPAGFYRPRTYAPRTYGPRHYGYGYGPPPVVYAPPPVVIPGANPYPPAGVDGGYKR